MIEFKGENVAFVDLLTRKGLHKLCSVFEGMSRKFDLMWMKQFPNSRRVYQKLEDLFLGRGIWRQIQGQFLKVQIPAGFPGGTLIGALKLLSVDVRFGGLELQVNIWKIVIRVDQCQRLAQIHGSKRPPKNGKRNCTNWRHRRLNAARCDNPHQSCPHLWAAKGVNHGIDGAVSVMKKLHEIHQMHEFVSFRKTLERTEDIQHRQRKKRQPWQYK